MEVEVPTPIPTSPPLPPSPTQSLPTVEVIVVADAEVELEPSSSSVAAASVKGDDIHSVHLERNMTKRGGSVFWFKACSMTWLHIYYWCFYAFMFLTVFHHFLWMIPLGLLIPRMVQHIHYVHHQRHKDTIPFFVTLSFLADSPISLSYKEVGFVHDTHHKYSCHPTKDLQYNLIASGKYLGIEAWLRNFLQPELEFYAYAVENKLSVDWIHFAIRLILFGVICAFMPYRFWYLVWFPVRFQRMQFYFFAFHFQHRDGDKYLPEGKNFVILPWTRPIISFLNGHENVLAMEYHIIHHARPYVTVEDHPKVLELCKNEDGSLKEVCRHHEDWHFPSYKRVFTIPELPVTDKLGNELIDNPVQAIGTQKSVSTCAEEQQQESS